MSSITSAAPSCTGNAWVLPVQDIACAVTTNSGNYSDIMDQCCGVADVESYNDDCGLYCLAQGQDGQTLLDCIQDQGVANNEVFCGGNLTQTASAPAPTSTGDSDDDSATPTDDADAPEDTGNAAVSAPVVNKAGLGVLAMVFCSALMGVVV
ncbi:hypothetical protein BDW62DRAFT_180885 [Aspergillus aurantiobrunneus]